jgi:hypothetical protein
MNKLKIWLAAGLVIAGSPVLAADVDHSKMGHSPMMSDASLTATPTIREKETLQKLSSMPASGKAREGGYDGRYVMESTDITNPLQRRCAQASRGLVMMSNAEWSRCGGKPDGLVQASRSAAGKTKTSNEHTGHNM